MAIQSILKELTADALNCVGAQLREMGEAANQVGDTEEARRCLLALEIFGTEVKARALAALIPLPVGSAVEVFSFGRWYPGTVERHGRKTVVVRYRTGTGVERVKSFGPLKVRAAHQ